LKERVLEEYAKSLVYISNAAVQGLLRLDKDGESGILVVYSTARKGSSEVSERRVRTELAVQMVRDAIGIDDLEVELVSGEDWTAKSEYSKGKFLWKSISFARIAKGTDIPSRRCGSANGSNWYLTCKSG